MTNRVAKRMGRAAAIGAIGLGVLVGLAPAASASTTPFPSAATPISTFCSGGWCYSVLSNGTFTVTQTTATATTGSTSGTARPPIVRPTPRPGLPFSGS